MKRSSTAPPKAKIEKIEKTEKIERIEEPVIERDTRTAPAPVEKRGPPDEMDKYDFKFKARQTPDMVRRSTTICGIFNRRNELVGQPSSVAPSEKPDDDICDMRAVSVSFKDTATTKPFTPGAFSRDLDSAFETIKIDEESGAKPKSRHHQSQSQGQPDFMKQLLVHKYHRRKRQKKPLNERIDDFFKQIDQVKQEDEEFAKQPDEWETKRKWKMINHGVKAALAESSDEEDNNKHTV